LKQRALAGLKSVKPANGFPFAAILVGRAYDREILLRRITPSRSQKKVAMFLMN